MKTTRITVPVSVDEREGLRLLAQQEMREPREQVRYLLQQELVKRGILVETNNRHDAKASTGHSVTAVAEVNP